jgi:Domain of unknown function (DUF4129)
LSRMVDRRRPLAPPPSAPPAVSPPPGPAEVRSALREAALAIEAGETPRDSIVRMYARLVGRVAPAPDELRTWTAEEIQRNTLADLCVPAARSEELTQIFEEACYSTHPIGPPDANRFVETMRAIERDLFMGGTPE